MLFSWEVGMHWLPSWGLTVACCSPRGCAAADPCTGWAAAGKLAGWLLGPAGSLPPLDPASLLLLKSTQRPGSRPKIRMEAWRPGHCVRRGRQQGTRAPLCAPQAP